MKERSLATRRVMKTIARRSAVQPLPVRLEDGTYPVVVALPEDNVAMVIKQTATYGGRANVFVAFPDRPALIEFHFTMDLDEDDPEVTATEKMTMEMYVAFLKMHDGPVSLTLKLSEANVEQFEYAF